MRDDVESQVANTLTVMLDECRNLRNRLGPVGGETLGQTLKRLSVLIKKVDTGDSETTTEDWKAFLHDLGEELHESYQTLNAIQEKRWA